MKKEHYNHGNRKLVIEVSAFSRKILCFFSVLLIGRKMLQSISNGRKKTYNRDMC